MPVCHRVDRALYIALALALCVLVLSACSQETVNEPPVEPPVSAQEEVAQPTATQAPVQASPEATPPPTLAPAATPEQADSEEAIDEVIAEPIEEAIDEAVAEPVEEATGESAEDTGPTATPEVTPTSRAPAAVATLPRERVVAAPALVIRPDTSVAPPLSIELSANRELEGHRFKVSGLLRNDAAEPYTSLGVIATFYRSDGSRYGPIRARIQCPILGPGDVCPFIVEATDRDLTDVMLHPEGRPTDRRQPISVELRTTGRYVDSIGYVHITGSVYNPNPVAAQDITINGVLLDNGEIVSIGNDLILGPVDPGASARFDVMVRYVPYSQTRLYVQALPPR
jgi:hypothetical protein